MNVAAAIAAGWERSYRICEALPVTTGDGENDDSATAEKRSNRRRKGTTVWSVLHD